MIPSADIRRLIIAAMITEYHPDATVCVTHAWMLSKTVKYTGDLRKSLEIMRRN